MLPFDTHSARVRLILRASSCYLSYKSWTSHQSQSLSSSTSARCMDSSIWKIYRVTRLTELSPGATRTNYGIIMSRRVTGGLIHTASSLLQLRTLFDTGRWRQGDHERIQRTDQSESVFMIIKITIALPISCPL